MRSLNKSRPPSMTLSAYQLLVDWELVEVFPNVQPAAGSSACERFGSFIIASQDAQLHGQIIAFGGYGSGPTNFESKRKCSACQGSATVLAIGTATPDNCLYQSDFADYYFRVTKSEHMTELKKKFNRICDKSMIKKRYIHLTEEMLEEHPNIGAYMAPSLTSAKRLSLLRCPSLARKQH
ncbi:Stilbene synthase 4 [Vitis vinifera]|uniref:Stilbene synthase 4 n=1 Tax=Vitis vinifera TaxID=29760 RepID=A0A438CX18_VITVI|nr:Stilbene synthase 4 [Vitis vinifera]